MEEENKESLPEEVVKGKIDLKLNGAKEWGKASILGFFIGLAVIVPGVSGSAVAIMMKLYERLLYAISNIFKRFKAAFLFLLPIVVGCVVGFALGFFAVQALIDLIPFAIILFFAGLVVGAYPSILDEYKEEKHTPWRIVLLVIGILIPIAISVGSYFLGDGNVDLASLQWYDYILYVVLGFSVAITQLIPGLSATALLMAIGSYRPLVESVSLTYWRENPMVLLLYVCLAVGFLAGLFLVSKGVTYVLKKWRGSAFHLIGGLSLGSIVSMIVSPEALGLYLDSWPNEGIDYLDLGLGIGLFIVGVLASGAFTLYERKKTKEIEAKPAE